MPDATFLYPRLGQVDARKRLGELKSMSLLELKQASTLEFPGAAPRPTGGFPVPPKVLGDLRDRIRAVADSAGFPDSGSGSSIRRFDRIAAQVLYETMNVVPSEAASEEVWNFLSLVVLPEIGPWRFPDRAEERLLGRPRNVMRRLWWRAWSLGPDLESAPARCNPLGEDEFVAIMERPSLGGNRLIAQSIRDALWRAEETESINRRSEVMRRLAVRTLALKSYLAIDSLDVDDARAVMDELVRESIREVVETATRRNL